MTFGALFVLAFAAAEPTSQPEIFDLQVRVIYGHNKPLPADPKLKDLEASLKDLKFTGYELKDQTTLKVQLGGPEVKYALPMKRHLHVSATEKSVKNKKEQYRVQLQIPELKFKTSAWISRDSALVVGGPKFEEGVLLFALGTGKTK